MYDERILVQATVTSVVGSHPIYPCCCQCYSKVLRDFQKKSWICRACRISHQADDVTWRYCLNLKIADTVASCSVTVFGKILEPFFGLTADDFHKFTQCLRKDGNAALAVGQGLEETFVGNTFLFGFKSQVSVARLKRVSTSSSITLAQILQGGRMLKARNGNVELRNLVAVVMLSPYVSPFPTVVHHICGARKSRRRRNISAALEFANKVNPYETMGSQDSLIPASQSASLCSDVSQSAGGQSTLQLTCDESVQNNIQENNRNTKQSQNSERSASSSSKQRTPSGSPVVSRRLVNAVRESSVNSYMKKLSLENDDETFKGSEKSFEKPNNRSRSTENSVGGDNGSANSFTGDKSLGSFSDSINDSSLLCAVFPSDVSNSDKCNKAEEEECSRNENLLTNDVHKSKLSRPDSGKENNISLCNGIRVSDIFEQLFKHELSSIQTGSDSANQVSANDNNKFSVSVLGDVRKSTSDIRCQVAKSKNKQLVNSGHNTSFAGNQRNAVEYYEAFTEELPDSEDLDEFLQKASSLQSLYEICNAETGKTYELNYRKKVSHSAASHRKERGNKRTERYCCKTRSCDTACHVSNDSKSQLSITNSSFTKDKTNKFIYPKYEMDLHPLKETINTSSKELQERFTESDIPKVLNKKKSNTGEALSLTVGDSSQNTHFDDLLCPPNSPHLETHTPVSTPECRSKVSHSCNKNSKILELLKADCEKKRHEITEFLKNHSLENTAKKLSDITRKKLDGGEARSFSPVSKTENSLQSSACKTDPSVSVNSIKNKKKQFIDPKLIIRKYSRVGIRHPSSSSSSNEISSYKMRNRDVSDLVVEPFKMVLNAERPCVNRETAEVKENKTGSSKPSNQRKTYKRQFFLTLPGHDSSHNGSSGSNSLQDKHTVNVKPVINQIVVSEKKESNERDSLQTTKENFQQEDVSADEKTILECDSEHKWFEENYEESKGSCKKSEKTNCSGTKGSTEGCNLESLHLEINENIFEKGNNQSSDVKEPKEDMSVMDDSLSDEKESSVQANLDHISLSLCNRSCNGSLDLFDASDVEKNIISSYPRQLFPDTNSSEDDSSETKSVTPDSQRDDDQHLNKELGSTDDSDDVRSDGKEAENVIDTVGESQQNSSSISSETAKTPRSSRSVKFSERLSRVSTVKLMDLRMRTSSPVVYRTETSTLKSCLKKQELMLKSPEAEKTDVISPEAPFSQDLFSPSPISNKSSPSPEHFANNREMSGTSNKAASSAQSPLLFSEKTYVDITPQRDTKFFQNFICKNKRTTEYGLAAQEKFSLILTPDLFSP